MKFVKARQS